MSVARLRRLLSTFSDSEWKQTLEEAPVFSVLASEAGRPQWVGVKGVRRWIRMPSKSDANLAAAVRLAASGMLSEEGGDRDDPPFPVDHGDLRDWLVEVASRAGAGPAKVCLAAAREDAPKDTPPTTQFDELLAVIDATPFMGLVDDESQPDEDFVTTRQPEQSVHVSGAEEFAAEPELDSDISALAQRRRHLEPAASGLASHLRDVASVVERGESTVARGLATDLDSYPDSPRALSWSRRHRQSAEPRQTG